MNVHELYIFSNFLKLLKPIMSFSLHPTVFTKFVQSRDILQSRDAYVREL